MVIVLRWVNDEKNTLCREHNDVNLPRSLTNLRAISDLTKIATQFFTSLVLRMFLFIKNNTQLSGGLLWVFSRQSKTDTR